MFLQTCFKVLGMHVSWRASTCFWWGQRPPGGKGDMIKNEAQGHAEHLLPAALVRQLAEHMRARNLHRCLRVRFAAHGYINMSQKCHHSKLASTANPQSVSCAGVCGARERAAERQQGRARARLGPGHAALLPDAGRRVRRGVPRTPLHSRSMHTHCRIVIVSHPMILAIVRWWALQMLRGKVSSVPLPWLLQASHWTWPGRRLEVVAAESHTCIMLLSGSRMRETLKP